MNLCSIKPSVMTSAPILVGTSTPSPHPKSRTYQLDLSIKPSTGLQSLLSRSSPDSTADSAPKLTTANSPRSEGTTCWHGNRQRHTPWPAHIFLCTHTLDGSCHQRVFESPWRPHCASASLFELLSLTKQSFRGSHTRHHAHPISHT